MNGKKARALRKMLQCDLSPGSEDRDHGVATVGGKTIAQIQPDGNHTYREAPIVEAKTTEARYLYRECKKVYSRPNKNPEVRVQLKADLNSKSEEADKE
jgi:hypothetical protein